MADLNERQWNYLKMIYEIDQDNERVERSGWNKGYKSRPASEWRPIAYDTLYSRLRNFLALDHLIDEGTGSTFEALETRGLIKRSYRLIDGSRILHTEITTTGRKLVRAATGEKPSKQLPTGTLRDYQWKALEEAYQAGPAGLPYDGVGRYGQFSWQTVWLRLRDYRQNGQPYPLVDDSSRLLKITTEGKDFYEQNLIKYQELYKQEQAQ